MSTWIFEPGHTEAEFRARHMMVTWVRGLFKDIHGRLELDWDRCLDATFEGEIDAIGVWTGEPDRDAHLRSTDFFDVENHPRITFRGRFTERTADTAFKGLAELTIRGVTRSVPLDIAYLGEWRTPWWEGEESKGEMRRIGFEAAARINRHDFGVSWQDDLPGGGVVVSNEIELFLDVEAILLDDLEATGAIGYYRRSVERSQTDRYLVRALGGVESDGNGDLDRPGRLGGRVRDGQRYEARPIESRAARLGQHGLDRGLRRAADQGHRRPRAAGRGGPHRARRL